MSLRQTARREQALQRVVASLTTTMDGLDEAAALAALATANATRLRPLHELDAWLREYPDALTNPGKHCPLALVRLAHALHTAGYTMVALPRCVVCGRPCRTLELGPEGRTCGACMAKSRKRACARCGQEGRILARRAEGGICHRCYRVDEQVVEPCGRCGRKRAPAARLQDGSPVCDTCWQSASARTCVRCGVTGPTHYRGPDGSLCPGCYRERRRPRRRCSRCGEIADIAKRGPDATDEVCYRCYRRPTAETECAACGRLRLCQRAGRSGPLLCASCRPARRVPCARCQGVKVVAVNWPMGPVCRSSYTAIRRGGDECAQCGRPRPLIGLATTTSACICGPCAGVDVSFRCRTCGTDEAIWADGQCPRCVVRARAVELLTGPDGQVEPQLVPLLDALVQADRPHTVIQWLDRSPVARTLAQLAAHGRPISHDDLDTLPLGHVERYARHLLVHTGVLPERRDDIDRVEVWLYPLLAGRPAAHARLIRPFATWHLLRRARRDAARRQPTPATGNWLRAQILTALDLLAWIDRQHLTLATLTQDDIDRWLAELAPYRRRAARAFLDWAAARRLTADHDIAMPSRQDPTNILDDGQRLQQLRRCLTDHQLPTEVRVAGALILLYGLAASRVTRLTTAALEVHNGQPVLVVGRKPLPLPPSLADLVTQLAEQPRVRAAMNSGNSSAKQWLFPGLDAGQPLTTRGMSNLLRRHGIQTLPGRHAGLIALAGALPTPILADALGIHVNTAKRWAGYLQSDWSTYLAARATDSRREHP